jgi:ribosome-binding protein aMBF1 (putative translation factor)
LLPGARVDGLEPGKCPRARRQVDWERPNRALSDQERPARRGNASKPRLVGGVNEPVKYADVDANQRRVKNLDMTIVEITGGMLRAARSLAGFSQQELADRASISRPCLTACEGSSDNVPNAKARALHRVVLALEAEGVGFSDDGVRLQRPAPVGTVLHSNEAMA